MAPQTDEELARRSARGDHSAFAALVERHSTALLNYCIRVLGNADDAADAAQQSFVQVYLHLPSGRSDLPFRPWLYRIARNQCIDRIRQRRAPVQTPITDQGDGVESAILGVSDPEPLPESVFEAKELKNELVAALLALPERYRSVVSLRYATDLTFGEIGAALGMPENTAKTLFQRAKAMLRDHLRGRLTHE